MRTLAFRLGLIRMACTRDPIAAFEHVITDAVEKSGVQASRIADERIGHAFEALSSSIQAQREDPC